MSAFFAMTGAQSVAIYATVPAVAKTRALNRLGNYPPPTTLAVTVLTRIRHCRNLTTVARRAGGGSAADMLSADPARVVCIAYSYTLVYAPQLTGVSN